MMNSLVLLLILLPIVGAFPAYFCGRRRVNTCYGILNTVSLLEFLAALTVCFLGEAEVALPGVCGFGLHFTVGGFRTVYLLATCFAWLMSSLFTAEYMRHGENQARYGFFLLLTLTGTVGVFLSADLYTTFVFFEIMSLSSYAWVAHEETDFAADAAATYLAVAIIGGLAALMGIWLLQSCTGTIVIAELSQAVDAARTAGRGGRLLAAAICLLIGFGAKAGMFPIHIWLPKAHAAAPATASSLLSGVLTKAGLFGVILISCEIMSGDRAWGVLMMVIALATMVTGGVLALFDDNIKRTLACSSVSQIGFFLSGCAVLTLVPHASPAAGGVVLHMLNHTLCKLVLFTCAGIAYMNTHTLSLEKLRGWGRGKPLFFAAFLLGTWGITGLPGGSGYISKTLLHEAILECGEVLSPAFVTLSEVLFLFSGGLTVAYMTKLFVVLFLEKAEGETKSPYMRAATAAAVLLPAVIIPLLGILPEMTANRIAEFSMEFFHQEHFHAPHYFHWAELKGAVISVSVGAVLYFLVVRPACLRLRDGRKTYVNARPAWLDLERYGYRPLLRLLAAVFGTFARMADSLMDGLIALLRATCYQDLTHKPAPEYGNRFTYLLGTTLDRIADSYCAVTHRTRIAKPYIYRVSKFYEIFAGEKRIITRSMGYAMMMTCIGIFVMVIYLFVHLF